MSFTHKRAILIGCSVFLSMMIAGALGFDSTTVGVCVAGISAGVAVVVFPDPEHLRRIEKEKSENSDRA